MKAEDSSSKETSERIPLAISNENCFGVSQDTYHRSIELSKFYNDSLVEEEAMFQDRMNHYGRLFNPPFKIIDVPVDGNCFYHAIQETINR